MLLRVTNGDAADAASAVVPAPPDVGAGVSGGAAWASRVTFADVDARARRLVDWAREESQYLRTHAVGLFSPADVDGRTAFADEGLYVLLPRLHADAARLRLACGRGPLWSVTKELCDQAADEVQQYYALWQRLRDGSRT